MLVKLKILSTHACSVLFSRLNMTVVLCLGMVVLTDLEGLLMGARDGLEVVGLVTAGLTTLEGLVGLAAVGFVGLATVGLGRSGLVMPSLRGFGCDLLSTTGPWRSKEGHAWQQ